MRKNLLAVFCVLTIFASTAPIFAADTSNTTPVVLTGTQLTKLTAIQKTLTDLITKIEGLKTTYKSTNKTKGLLTALNQFEKQAKQLNTTITNYKKNPTKNANMKIRSYHIKTNNLVWKVAVTSKILKKVTTKKPIKPIVPVHPIKPIKPIHPIHPVVPVHPVTNATI